MRATVRRIRGRSAGLAILTALVLGGCSAGADGTIPAASRFGAREVPCAEIDGFAYVVDVLPAEWDVESVCWTRGASTDLGGLVTGIRDAIAPIQDVTAFVEPTCGPSSQNPIVEECAIGGIVSDDPYTIVSVVARPTYTTAELALLESGQDVQAATVEIHIQITDLGGAIDQWTYDQDGTHID
ncbi:MAG: hypothetical protein JW722_06090 [Demequinaceae bacterium]|nr:hypothetical protein [Demequinaceae bacterium]